MNLRGRLAIAFAAIGAVAAILVGVLSYQTAAQRIHAELDRSLATSASEVAAGARQILAPTTLTIGPGDDDHDEAQRMVAQTVAPDGTVRHVGGRPVTLPVGQAQRALAASPVAAGTTATASSAAGNDADDDADDGIAGDVQGVEYTDATLGHDDYRVITVALGAGRGALALGIDVDETRIVLDDLAVRTGLVSLLVLLVAAGAGWLLAWRITRRLERLTAATETVGTEGRFEVEVGAGGRDEVGRLATSFRTMLARLAAARADQERLVQDAAHELRTPLTSLRTNTSVLRRYDQLTPDARERLLADLDSEARELTTLVTELVDSATQHDNDEETVPVALAATVERAADRARRRSGRTVRIDADDTTALGRPKALERAVSNLVENAIKFDPGAGPVDITVHAGTVTVLDRGPGIPADEAQRVFDRFHRSATARALPGSGLGLAIVREIAHAHGGDVFAGPREGGGAVVGFTLGAETLLPDSHAGHVGS